MCKSDKIIKKTAFPEYSMGNNLLLGFSLLAFSSKHLILKLKKKIIGQKSLDRLSHALASLDGLQRD